MNHHFHFDWTSLSKKFCVFMFSFKIGKKKNNKMPKFKLYKKYDIIILYIK